MKAGNIIEDDPSIPEERAMEATESGARHTFTTQRAKIQLTFKNITVTAPPK